MAFTVEDGTGKADANSLVAVEYADAYHSDRGNAAWTGDEAAKQAALVKATDYIQQRYAGKWRGLPTTDTQALDWPRYDVLCVNSNEIPARLKQAVCQLALEGLSEELNPTLGRAVKREKVDVIEVEYMDNAKATNDRPAIDGLLRPYLSGTFLNGKVVRV